MLLPYYIASMNIEHEYFEKVGVMNRSKEFVWSTLSGLPSRADFALFMTEENTERIESQKNRR